MSVQQETRNFLNFLEKNGAGTVELIYQLKLFLSQPEEISLLQEWVVRAEKDQVPIHDLFKDESLEKVHSLSDELLVDLIDVSKLDSNVSNPGPFRTKLRLILNELHDPQLEPSYALNIGSCRGIDPACTADVFERGFAPLSDWRNGGRTLHQWCDTFDGPDWPVVHGSGAIVSIDLSDRYISDGSAKVVRDIVEKLMNLMPERKFAINLDRTAFHGYYTRTRQPLDEMITFILNHPRTVYLSMRETPFGSLDRKDFFQKMTTDQLSKLVVFPEKFIKTDLAKVFEVAGVVDAVELSSRSVALLRALAYASKHEKDATWLPPA